MALILTDDEQALADSVRRFVADRSPLTSLRQLISSGEPFDADVWKQLSAQLGLAGLAIPEELRRLRRGRLGAVGCPGRARRGPGCLAAAGVGARSRGAAAAGRPGSQDRTAPQDR